LLRRETVVSLAAEGEIVGVVPSVTREGLEMMELEPLQLTTPRPRSVDERALPFISLENTASNSRWNVSRRLRR